ncbi:MAG: 5-(carboxyamino)imidazole ribonucleotide synthase [Sphingobacteriales bacterium]|nr:MAG: 5-(carboxyamino)imidazole ribonucleotide synthase [Sphingobacteriales bacterium]
MQISQNIKLGILGGGQLGSMLIRSAIDFGLNVSVMDKDPNATCARYTSSFTNGSLLDYDAVVNFGKDKDIVTIEIEAVNVDALEALEKQGVKVYPSPAIIRMVQDKYEQKKALMQFGVPVMPGVLINNKEELNSYKEKLPACLKLCRDGYDGRGVMILKSEQDIAGAFDKPSVLEDLASIKYEIAVIVSRNTKGEVSTFDPVMMIFDNERNILDYQLCPANISKEQEKKAREMAAKIGEGLGLVGILAVEMFVTTDDKIVINELAPRPHNSGHHSIEGCVTSQYEQHIRAMLGLPLGDTSYTQPSVMVNLLEPHLSKKEDFEEAIQTSVSISGSHLHWYGKKGGSEGRKMGHVTILGSTIEDAENKAQKIRQLLKK